MQYVGYLRWSSDKQSKGSSDDRQRDLIQEYCDEEGWHIDQWLTDDGVSASTGANVRMGLLSEFIKRIEVEGGDDYTLLVECQDRLSRLHEFDFFEWFIGVLRTGLTVVFCDNEMVVDQRSIRNQKRQMRRIMDDQEEAHRYTDKLSRRVRKAWQEMRETGKKKVHTQSTCPAWLTLNRERTEFSLNEERVAIVLQIFEWYIDGVGLRQIAKRLNEAGVPTFRKGDGWQASAVRALIHSRALLGEYQHKSRAQGLTIGEPVPDYFPQVVSNELWQAAHEPRLAKVQSAKTQGDKFRNLFGDVARCRECDSKMVFVEKSPRAGARYTAYLQCDSYARRKGCGQARMVKYQPIEQLVVKTLLEAALDDQHFRKDDDVRKLSIAIADQRRALEEVIARRTIWSKAVDRGSVTAIDSVLECEAEEVRIRGLLADLESELKTAHGAVSPTEHVRRVGEIALDLDSEDEALRLHARRVTKLAFNDLIERFDMEAGTVLNRVGRTEQQVGVIVLRGSMRFLHIDLSGKLLADISNGAFADSDDPVISDYYRRIAA